MTHARGTHHRLGGLIGSESARYFARQGFDVVGIDNDMRAYFFGDEASTAATARGSPASCGDFRARRRSTSATARRSTASSRGRRRDRAGVHTAAQPSHDWAAREPLTDFDVNAVGTLNVLEAARAHAPERDVHLHLARTRSTATARTAAARRARRRAGS